MRRTKSSCYASRRLFLRRLTEVGAGALAFPYIIPAASRGAEGATPPSDRVTMGIIGTGNQGHNDIRAFLGDERVQIVALCDVNKESDGYWNGAVGGREPARRLVDTRYVERFGKGTYKGCDVYNDFRELTGRSDIDAVEVCTPDHWHALLAISACKAGKDVYCQKPLSLTIAEGRAMSDAAAKYKRIFQTGSQQRSDKKFRRAAELVRNKKIGELTRVVCGLPGGRPDISKKGNRKQVEPVPPGFDYNMWLGPAPDASYCPARCHVNFRWILDYSGGQLTDWGGHHPDCAQWAMGTERTGPVTIRNAKGEFPPDELYNTATEYYFEAVYKNGLVMVISNKARGGVTFEGTEGKVWVNRGQIESDPKSILDSPVGPNDVRLYESDNHYRNFIDCVLSRKETIAPAEVAHRSITICHLGNIAMRLEKSTLTWDPDKEQIVGDAQAAAMLSRPYRAPWELPV